MEGLGGTTLSYAICLEKEREARPVTSSWYLWRNSNPSPEKHNFLGDVVVSEAEVEYDFGTLYPGGFQQKTDVKDTLGRANREIRTLIAGLGASQSRREFRDLMLRYLHAIQQKDQKQSGAIQAP
ncbi:hypothetical protein TSTA_088480 [Talaromyces stipitatus ATCC 10500]|uniref:Uncharacterized protein n=1 Tax=Talaromyces stipitatus (strain ATCC 10500 / CBS 375.48 / QM 6759 / NRRL 1006) TaxID=441959 RepID=B8M2E8_TALSN|nr:uncharacterized protein TSTA_088480 [Talaromyces stipitatus ATCC 10500]EED21612.1 hypothetical protein TSTA_088480 [Talaromyces stipitatus ATCC 10500]